MLEPSTLALPFTRAFWIITSLALVLITASPAAGSGGEPKLGETTEVTFDADPCLNLCAWEGPLYGSVCGRFEDRRGFDQLLVRAPPGADHLRFEAFPEIDWDIFICDLDGVLLGIGTPNQTDEPCVGPTIVVGCAETAEAVVRPGETYVLRAGNFSDLSDLRARYTFLQLIAPQPPPPSTDPPTLAGVTTISAEGNGMIRLQAPHRLRFDPRLLDLRLVEGTYAFVAIVEDACQRPRTSTCLAFQGLSLPGSFATPWFIAGAGRDGIELTGGFRAYILTDGSATLSIGSTELSGRLGLIATEDFVGHMEPLPGRCEPSTGCRVVEGGAVRTLSSHGYVMAFGYASAPSRTSLGTSNMGLLRAGACIELGAAAPPHERGCGMRVSHESAEIDRRVPFTGGGATLPVVGTNSSTRTTAAYSVWDQEVPPGSAYAGFSAAYLNGSRGTKLGGYAVWLEPNA